MVAIRRKEQCAQWVESSPKPLMSGMGGKRTLKMLRQSPRNATPDILYQSHRWHDFRRQQGLRDLCAPAYSREFARVDLNQLLHRHQVALMQLDRAESPEDRRAHSQFASDYAEKIHIARDELGAPAQLRASSDDQSGHAACVMARVVLMPPKDLPYSRNVPRWRGKPAPFFSYDAGGRNSHPTGHADSGSPLNSL